ncbi:MAG: hypothetical protein JWN81_1289 [Solirubrobacterales bacterium]|nr:hypothetical protein [Solirubrobacterales bacterium]
MWTTTWVVSLALPLKDGFVLFDSDGGPVSVTVGEAVLIENSTVALVPGSLPSEVDWVAYAG